MEPAAILTILNIIWKAGAAVLVLSAFAWGIYYYGKANRVRIENLEQAVKDEAQARETEDKHLNQRIDNKAEKFENALCRLDTKIDDSNKLLHMIAGKLGVGDTDGRS